MGERLVRLRHFMRIYFLSDRAAFILGSLQKLIGKPFGHALFRPLLGERDEPPDCEGNATFRRDLDRHLIVGAANSAGLDLEHRFDIINSLLENAQCVLASRPFIHNCERVVENALGKTPLAPPDDIINKLGDQRTLELGIGSEILFFCFSSSGHGWFLLLGLLDAVFGTALFTVGNTLRIKRSADDMVAHAGNVLDTTAPDYDDGMFLKIVALAGDIGVNLDMIGQSYARNLSKRRIGFLRRRREHARAYTTPLRTGL